MFGKGDVQGGSVHSLRILMCACDCGLIGCDAALDVNVWGGPLHT